MTASTNMRLAGFSRYGVPYCANENGGGAEPGDDRQRRTSAVWGGPRGRCSRPLTFAAASPVGGGPLSFGGPPPASTPTKEPSKDRGM